VLSFNSRISRRVAWYSGETGALTRIQGGLRGTGLSGRAAFSGWRTTTVLSLRGGEADEAISCEVRVSIEIASLGSQ